MAASAGRIRRILIPGCSPLAAAGAAGACPHDAGDEVARVDGNGGARYEWFSEG
jgi:hypothetical protein